MTNSSGPHSPAQRLRRLQSIWPLTVRQRIAIYIILGACVGLACAGVDYTIDANRMDCVVTAFNDAACHAAKTDRQCQNYTFTNGKCQLNNCIKPCSASTANNCPFGKTNGNFPWTSTDCRNQTVLAGCTNGTLYSFGCYGYNCSDPRCGRP